MGGSNVSTIVSILQDLLYTAVFLLCAAVAYLTLQRPLIKQWLASGGTLTRVVLFIILTELLVRPANAIVGDLLAFPIGLINRSNGFLVGARCLGGLLALAGLGIGSWLLVRRPPTDK